MNLKSAIRLKLGGLEKINLQPSTRRHAFVQNAVDQFDLIGLDRSNYPLLTPDIYQKISNITHYLNQQAPDILNYLLFITYFN